MRHGLRIAAVAAFTCCGLLQAQEPYVAAAFTPDGALRRPADPRELVYLTSGSGMAYGPARNQAANAPPFTNVLVTPQAYRAFLQTGVWPEGTAFFLEIRQGMEQVSINQRGLSQGRLLALEAAVKDTARYPDGGWAYFDFGRDGLEASARPFERTASCYSCHRQHGAVEWTFTQFYPDLFAVAQQKGTIREDYDPAAKVQ